VTGKMFYVHGLTERQQNTLERQKLEVGFCLCEGKNRWSPPFCKMAVTQTCNGRLKTIILATW
jgi:hypothetical protein